MELIKKIIVGLFFKFEVFRTPSRRGWCVRFRPFWRKEWVVEKYSAFPTRLGAERFKKSCLWQAYIFDVYYGTI